MAFMNRKVPFWMNDGTTVLTGLVSGSNCFWQFSPTTNGNFVNNPGAGSVPWSTAIATKGAFGLTVQWRSKITAIGGLGTVTAGNVSILALGTTWHDNADYIPHVVQTAAILDGSGLDGGKRRNISEVLYGAPGSVWENNGARSCTSDMAVVPNWNFTSIGAAYQPATNDIYKWRCRIGERPDFTINQVVQAGNAGMQYQLSIVGISHVWIAVMFNGALGGTLATTKIEGNLDLIFTHDGGSVSMPMGPD